MLFWSVAVLLIGFVLLIKGADFFVEGSAAAARKMRVPGIIIGLTIVAMGTSAPEMAVSISAALQGSNEIAISNVEGSNIFNLLVVLGVSSLLSPLKCDKKILKGDYPFMLAISIALIFVMGSRFIKAVAQNGINSSAVCGSLTRLIGITMILLFVVYIAFTVKSALKMRTKEDETQVFFKPWQIIAYIAGGLGAIIAGGNMVVNSGREVALILGMSETLVGLTIVAIGTSLPELVTSAVAAKKGENGLALGNVIGSNIFNVLLILGVSAAITPIDVTVQAVVDAIVLAGVGIIVFIFAKTHDIIDKKEGSLMLVFYAAYMAYAIIR